MAARIRAALIPTILALTLAFCAYAQLRPEVTVKPKPKKPPAAKVTPKPAEEAETSVTPQPAPGTVMENPKDGLKYVWIPPGSFMMGCSPGDGECYANEKPAHRVTITKGFWIGQTEVTVGAYKRFTRETGRAMPKEPKEGNNALNPSWRNQRMPVVNVSWDDAVAYCRWAGGRLPTEAEWEYAARAGSTGVRYGPLGDVAWYADNSGRSRIDSARMMREEPKKYTERLTANSSTMHEVGQKRPNARSLYDMLGNVWEWVNDWYGYAYYRGSADRDPPGPGTGQLRVLRGGSWYEGPGGLRVSSRNADWPDSRFFGHGFRCSREVVR